MKTFTASEKLNKKHGKTIKVWDSFIRIFHWSLVTAFAVAYLTEEELLSVHTLAGYVIIGLLVLRLVWGFIGTPHARFVDFTFSISSIRAFLTDTLYLRARRYIGHNPAGGAMVYLLLFSLVLASVSGLSIYAASEHAGPLAGFFSDSGGLMKEVLEETHEFFASFIVFLILVHIAGVVAESLIHQENLVAAMISGNKRALPGKGRDQ